MYSASPIPELPISSPSGTSNLTIIVIGLILLLVLFLFYFKLYIDNNFVNGVTLNIKDTIKNIFRINNIATPAPSPKLVSSSSKINSGSSPKCAPKPKKPKCKLPKNKPKCNLPRITPPTDPVNEVFNIDNNDFTYDEAHLLCKALDSKLATYDQLLKAHKKGANWCNYGWSANGLALYPTQERFWKKLQQKGKGHKDKCGKPGINGGFFPDKSMKFGVNCYGPKPQPDESKITYINNKCNIDKELIDEYRKKIREGLIEVRPFNKKKWSKHSNQESKYILTPKGEEDLILEKQINNIDKL